jgi:hypothetical protein
MNYNNYQPIVEAVVVAVLYVAVLTNYARYPQK